MTTAEEISILEFSEIRAVLSNSEKFKIKLGIGRDAYASLRLGKTASILWDVGGVAGTGASVAASSTVASTFFGTLWTTIGIGTAATPVGWVVGAALVSGGAYYGVTRLFRSYSGSRINEIPKFLNTGLDVLATTILDLMGSLALKVAAIDGQIDPVELEAISEYFEKEWGYDRAYLDQALKLMEENIGKSRLSDMASELATFAKTNPDCNFDAMRGELRTLLIEIAEADGHLDEREDMAIERINKALSEQSSLLAAATDLASASAKNIGGLAATAMSGLQSTLAGMKGTPPKK